MAVEISGDTTPGLAADFWRQAGSATLLPDGTTDESEGTNRSGKVGLGQVQTRTPVALLDLAHGVRSGTDRRNAADPLFITGALSPGPTLLAPAAFGGSADAKAYLGHSNQTQGLAFSYQGIQKAGAGHFILGKDDPNGQYGIHWFGTHASAPGAFWNWVRDTALTQNQGWHFVGYAAAVQQWADLIRRRTDLVGGANAIERWWQQRRPDNAFVNVMRSTWSGQDANSPALWVNPGNQGGDRLLTLWGDPAGPAGGNVFSIGIRSAELASFVGANSHSFRWRRASDGAVALALLSTAGSGILTIDPPGVSAGVGGGNPAIRVGGETSTEQIASNRTAAGRFLDDIEIGTAGVRRFAVLNNGRIYMANVPTFANDGAAGAGGLAAGELYKSAAGDVKVKL